MAVHWQRMALLHCETPGWLGLFWGEWVEFGEGGRTGEADVFLAVMLQGVPLMLERFKVFCSGQFVSEKAMPSESFGDRFLRSRLGIG